MRWGVSVLIKGNYFCWGSRKRRKIFNSSKKMQGGDEAMKELILEVEELEQRIAPGSASNGSG